MFAVGELFSMYRTNFLLMHKFHYDIQYFENMIPFERDVYILMLLDHLHKQRTKKANG